MVHMLLGASLASLFPLPFPNGGTSMLCIIRGAQEWLFELAIGSLLHRTSQLALEPLFSSHEKRTSVGKGFYSSHRWGNLCTAREALGSLVMGLELASCLVAQSDRYKGLYT